MIDDLRELFPNLNARNHRITSPQDPGYNCVAWAAGDSSRWWDHVDGFWPDDVPQDGSVDAYVELFQGLGFESCDNPDPEPGFEKIAVYGDDGQFTHVARFLASGNWTSKLGGLEDIEHNNLESLTESSYGRPLVFLRRARITPLPALT